MASHVVVVDSTARRAMVKTSPGTYLSDVLEEACKKLGAQSSQFTLKHNNKQVDLSRTVRLAGLPGGAKLDLVQASRSPSVVSVALQLPESEKNIRLTQKFPSNTSLWQILRVFESNRPAGPGETNEPRNFNLTQRGVPQMGGAGSTGAGRLHYETPVLNVMQRERSTFVELQQTLAQLGINSGSALLRLTFRNSGKPLEEAMAEISKYFQDVETLAGPAIRESVPAPAPAPAPAPGAHAQSVGEMQSDPAPDPASTSTAIMAEADSPPIPVSTDASPQETHQGPPEPTPEPNPESNPAAPTSQQPSLPTYSTPRPIQIFLPPTSPTPHAARQTFNPSDYVPTVDHAKLHQARLTASTRNARLPSTAELDAAAATAAATRAAVDHVAVRVRLPDQAQLETTVSHADAAADLYTLVRSVLRPELAGQPFVLRYAGQTGAQVPLEEGAPRRLIPDLGFRGRVLVSCVWGPGASAEARSGACLAAEWAARGTALKVENVESAGEGDGGGSSGQWQGGGRTLGGGGGAEGKGKGKLSAGEKEGKMKAFLQNSLFKKK